MLLLLGVCFNCMVDQARISYGYLFDQDSEHRHRHLYPKFQETLYREIHQGQQYHLESLAREVSVINEGHGHTSGRLGFGQAAQASGCGGAGQAT